MMDSIGLATNPAPLNHSSHGWEGYTKAVFSIIGAVIKGGFGIFGGIAGGLIKIIGGIFTGQGGTILEGIWDLLSPIFGTIIVVAGKVIALLQSIFYAQAFERPLTRQEKDLLKRVFKKSLNYYVIRIIEGHSGLFGLSSRPFTLGNTIYMKSDMISTGLLVHETTHVWQYQQTGNRYASDAITAQWFVTDEYNWQREIEERNKDDWSDFNKEAQAEFFEDIWKAGKLRDGNGVTLKRGNGAFYDADELQTFGHFEVNRSDYTGIARDAVRTIRNEWF
jgi:hypothetical protein